jgi:hypothetical protein
MPDQEIVVQITAPLDVVQKLRAEPVTGVDFEPPTGGREQTTRFGLAEAALALAVCAGIEKVIKLAIEIRNALREKHQPGAESSKARITTADQRLQLDISEDDTLEDLEHAIEEVLKAAELDEP